MRFDGKRDRVGIRLGLPYLGYGSLPRYGGNHYPKVSDRSPGIWTVNAQT
jgi:hypothetical protein